MHSVYFAAAAVTLPALNRALPSSRVARFFSARISDGFFFCAGRSATIPTGDLLTASGAIVGIVLGGVAAEDR